MKRECATCWYFIDPGYNDDYGWCSLYEGDTNKSEGCSDYEENFDE